MAEPVTSMFQVLNLTPPHTITKQQNPHFLKFPLHC